MWRLVCWNNSIQTLVILFIFKLELKTRISGDYRPFKRIAVLLPRIPNNQQRSFQNFFAELLVTSHQRTYCGNTAIGVILANAKARTFNDVANGDLNFRSFGASNLEIFKSRWRFSISVDPTKHSWGFFLSLAFAVK